MPFRFDWLVFAWMLVSTLGAYARIDQRTSRTLRLVITVLAFVWLTVPVFFDVDR